MRIFIHSGTDQITLTKIQFLLSSKRKFLMDNGVLYPNALGRRNHSRAFIASLPSDVADPLRSQRGYNDPRMLEVLNQQVRDELAVEIRNNRPDTLILSISEAAPRLVSVKMLKSLFLLASEFSDDLHAVLNIASPAEALAQQFVWQVFAGRTSGLEQEVAVSKNNKGWLQGAIDIRGGDDIATQQFASIQNPTPSADSDGIFNLWKKIFGDEEVSNFPMPDAQNDNEILGECIGEAFSLPQICVNKIKTVSSDKLSEFVYPSWQHLGRVIALNQFLKEKELLPIPQKLRRQIINRLADDGPKFNAEKIQGLFEESPQFSLTGPEPEKGFDIIKKIEPFMPAIVKAHSDIQKRVQARIKSETAKPVERVIEPVKDIIIRKQAAAPELNDFLDQQGKEIAHKMANSRFAPKNSDVVNIQETIPMVPIDADNRPEPTGTLLIGCMKNEAPYILEWIAYHRSIGVDEFLIYSNDCTDGTKEMLKQLDKLGIIYHKNNDNWKGNSPQQAALNDALKHKAYRKAKWLIHIDVDEFINIRAGESGTLAEVYDMMGPATNLAMTWRLFGHSGVKRFQDESVLEQFTSCAPSYCPKPHTSWGFKTLLRNNGAYEKLSCHRPNKLIPERENDIKWLNGSLVDMGDDVKTKGWRSSMNTIGYDAIQLNHYALRSAESFLVKRQRGRALHVDRYIGLNYWVRMDWNNHQDVTILRHVPRMKAELESLKSDPKLSKIHDLGVNWHQEKAKELHETPEFEELYQQAISLELTDLERMAAALAADMES